MNSHSRIRRAKDSVEAIMTQKAMGIRSNMIKHNIKWIHWKQNHWYLLIVDKYKLNRYHSIQFKNNFKNLIVTVTTQIIAKIGNEKGNLSNEGNWN
jgi:hypothetical protein